MIRFSIFIALLLGVMACKSNENTSEAVIWLIEDPTEISGHQPEVLGNPERMSTEFGEALAFDGEDDGLIIPINPVEGWESFTIEVLFRPDSDGPEEQRFLHFQGENENRGLIETRMIENGRWALDTYLYNKSTDTGLTLLDREINHPSDEFYWAALVYDGNTMSHYVNAAKELEGEIDFPVMGAGRTSIGVRLNQVYWFKGLIREIRFHPKALSEEDLQAIQ